MLQHSHVFNGEPGTKVTAHVDWWVINDAVSADVVGLLKGKKLNYPGKVKVFIDHDTPCGSVDVAIKQKAMIQFAEENGCELFNGYGISHQIMLDRFVKQGDIVAGCFSYGAMYGAKGALGVSLTPEALAESLLSGEVTFAVPKAVHIQLEGILIPPASGKDVALLLRAHPEYKIKDSFVVFSGSSVTDMSMAVRTTLCQMLDAAFSCFSESSALFPDIAINLAEICPVIVGPDALDALQPVTTLSGTAINEVFIGGCSGGRIEDLRLAASIVAGHRVPPRLRLMVAPATTEVYRQAADEGLLEIFLNAGAILMNQGCSVCWGKSQGVVDDSEVLLSAGSRNHKGCAGADSAKVYLCSPAVAAYSALAGTIAEGER